jgi:hypothetical protein
LRIITNLICIKFDIFIGFVWIWNILSLKYIEVAS